VGRVHVFSDEAGDFVFKPPREGISRYFMIGTVTVRDCGIGDRVLALKRDLAFDGMVLDGFHASSDKQWVRDRVFEVIADADLRYDVTILDKRKTIDKYRRSALRFYKLAWYLHFKYVAPIVADHADELLVVASSLQISKKKKVVGQAVEDVVAQVAPTLKHHTAFSANGSDPCLQVADYCTWAVQRKYEMGDTRSYDLIDHHVRTEFHPFAGGSKTFY
jgi:hypothetical protein